MRSENQGPRDNARLALQRHHLADVFFPKSQFGREKVSVHGHQQNEWVGVGFEMTARRESRLGLRHRPARYE